MNISRRGIFASLLAPTLLKVVEEPTTGFATLKAVTGTLMERGSSFAGPQTYLKFLGKTPTDDFNYTLLIDPSGISEGNTP